MNNSVARQYRRKAAALLAQHELNIEIFMAFVYTLDWMMKQNALPELNSRQDSIIQKLNDLFQNAETYHSLEQLCTRLAYSEQDQIHNYYTKSAFLKDQPYGGSAVETVTFLRRLSNVFRDQLFPERQIRLFLLVDEFEVLSEIQQVALNTVMKMRLPDLTLKIAVRKLGRKTSATFTPDDPIQEPRDYTLVRMDYDASQSSYRELLNGIASKRLEAAEYLNTDIRTYLPNQPQNEEATPDELEDELQQMWKDGNRRKDQIDDEFRSSHKSAAVYRVTWEADEKILPALTSMLCSPLESSVILLSSVNTLSTLLWTESGICLKNLLFLFICKRTRCILSHNDSSLRLKVMLRLWVLSLLDSLPIWARY